MGRTLEVSVGQEHGDIGIFGHDATATIGRRMQNDDSKRLICAFAGNDSEVLFRTGREQKGEGDLLADCCG
jgi:hypothetical protein